MPKKTRVHRCVRKLTDRYGYSGAIAICQKSTKQNYNTGKKLRKKTKKKRRPRRKTVRKKRRRGRRSRRKGARGGRHPFQPTVKRAPLTAKEQEERARSVAAANAAKRRRAERRRQGEKDIKTGKRRADGKDPKFLNRVRDVAAPAAVNAAVTVGHAATGAVGAVGSCTRALGRGALYGTRALASGLNPFSRCRQGGWRRRRSNRKTRRKRRGNWNNNTLRYHLNA